MEEKVQEKEIHENQEINKETKDNEVKNKNIPLETEEEEINKEDIKDIVDYLSNLDYEKYSRDMEIKEALTILKSKIDKEQEEKNKEQEIQNEKVKIIENKTLYLNNKEYEDENKEKNLIEENTININRDENENIKNNEIKEPKEIVDEEEVKKKEKN